MKLMIIVLLVAFGLILGSFANALVWRFHAQAERAEQGAKKGKLTDKQLSMVTGRSMCSNCHHELAAKDLIPLFSWVALAGKCRYCHEPIQDSPLLELLLPVLFVVSYLAWPSLSGADLFTFVFWLVFLVGFIALAAYDFRWFLLPDRIVFPLVGLALLQLAGELLFYQAGWPRLLSAFWGVLIASGIFYALNIISDGRWVGRGDAKLGIVLGLLVGGPVAAMLMLFIASMLGTLVSLPLLASGKANRASKLPFGPYLMVATVIVVLYGAHIIDWYYRLTGLA